MAVKSDSSPIVTLKSINSVVQGSTFVSYDGRPFNAFRGIPFGKPTSGELRFKPPQPVESWAGIFDANVSGGSCPQFDKLRGISGSEDCLHLNVYSPKVASTDDSLLPVIFFIHGGGYVVGSGSYDAHGPENWMDHDVVLVIPNYRLGIFGFLSTEDSNAYGNYALLDQILALKWIQENIEGFGGDPSKVTIVGHSAGSVSVIYHLLSPLSSGLFHAAVAQSGVPYMNKGTFQPHPLHWAKKLAKKVNCTTHDSAGLVACLREKTFTEILEGHKLLKISNSFPMFISPSS
ncbi:Carboxylesterase 5A [Chamberlinius hualienensis]